MEKKNIGTTQAIVSFAMISALLFWILDYTSCGVPTKTQRITTDTISQVRIVERPVYISDTIRIKSVSWRTRDSIIFVKDEVPCGDTSFIAQADSVLLPTGDTLNLAFNYWERKGSFSVVYRPRPDSIVTRTVHIPVMQETKSNLEYIFGAFGVGILVGIGAMLSNR